MFAILHDDIELARLLLEAGADVSDRTVNYEGYKYKYEFVASAKSEEMRALLKQYKDKATQNKAAEVASK